MSTKKTLWTVAAGSTAAVLIPGVAFAITAGGPIKETQEPVEDTAVVQPAQKPGQTANLSAPAPPTRRRRPRPERAMCRRSSR